MKKTIYLAQAIPYVNAAPHIGHALEFVQADSLARFWRLLGWDVLYTTGTDDNSLKNLQTAEAEGLPTKEVVDKYAKQFEGLKEVLNISWDIFNRTSSKEHFRGAQKLWSLCKKEDIYKKKYKGLYCVGCEAFYKPDEIVLGKCPDGHSNIEEVAEENYFFKLSNYQRYLERLIANDKLRILPISRKNEVLSFIAQGLEDFSISRSVERARGWGVPVPGDGSQVLYVWFDALTTYLTALGFGNEESLYRKFWPAMLTSAGIPLPSSEFVHGYVTLEGQKISKTLGNVIDPFELVDKFGVDAIRFYLLREIPAWGDGDFALLRFKDLYNGELANGLGNLVARVARLAADTKLNLPEKKNFKFKKVVVDNLKNFRFDLALIGLWEEISQLDRRINEEKPWELTGLSLKKSIAPIAREIREIAFNLSPFLPRTSEEILDQFTGKISAEKPLFPRI